VRRNPKKGRYERARIEAILDRSLVGHVAFVAAGEPVCMPTLIARVGHRIYVHGSTASRMLRLLAQGNLACLAVTHTEGLVLARSAFEHSVNYESVVAFGRFAAVDDPDERLAALEAFTEKILPGRWREVRPPNRKELKATAILAIDVDEASAKVRSGPPDDDGTADAALDVWAGEVPLVTSFGTPLAAPGLRPEIPVSASIERLLASPVRV
jgi:nitroimidazol reductase NimA-like FMN-containing flavoprotein (pyridoxamine 5'-phosphate oxidase superfamily)